jgi:hypothetical protein
MNRIQKKVNVQARKASVHMGLVSKEGLYERALHKCPHETRL